MRLQILEDGHRPLQKVLFKVMKFISRIEVSGPIRVLSYKSELVGKQLAACFQEGMRGGEEWSVGEVELFAAFVAKVNQCQF